MNELNELEISEYKKKEADTERLIESLPKLNPEQIKVYANMITSVALYNQMSAQMSTMKSIEK